MNKSTIILLVIVAAVLVIVVGNKSPLPDSGGENVEQVLCTTEAKLCPDGSAVGRSGPKCEFAECSNSQIIFGKEATALCGHEPPVFCFSETRLGCSKENKKWDCYSLKEKGGTTAVIDTSGWKTYHNDEYGYTIKYPDDYVVNYQDTTDILAIKKIGGELDPDDGGIKIGIERNPNHLSFDEYFDGYNAEELSISEGRQLILPNEPAYSVYEFNPSNCLCTIRIIPRKDHFIDAHDVNSEPLDTIIASIKFDK